MVLTRRITGPAGRHAVLTVAAALFGAPCAIAQVPAAAAAAPAALSLSVAFPQTPAGLAPSAQQPQRPDEADADAGPQQQRRTAWLGIGLSCTRCSYHTEGKSLSRWVFNEPPVLYQVEPGGPADRAGLRNGDTLVSINGQPLTSARGGQTFANLTPGVAVRLGYRRDGRDRSATVRPTVAPVQRELAEQREAIREAARAQAEAQQRTLTRDYQRDAERAQRRLQQLEEELGRTRGKVLSDSSMRVLRDYLAQAQRALEADPSPLLAVPAPVPSPSPAVPAPPAALAAPAPPARSLGYAIARPGGLRYSGRLGPIIIEARRPGGVDVIETGDSEVVLTGGDLSVRIALDRGRPTATRLASVASEWAAARSDRGDIARGIQGYLLNERLGRALGASSGVLVLDVQRGSHADSLGIVPGDVLVLLNDHPVVSITTEAPPAVRVLRRGPAPAGAESAVVVRARNRHMLVMPAAPRTTPRPAPPARRNP